MLSQRRGAWSGWFEPMVGCRIERTGYARGERESSCTLSRNTSSKRRPLTARGHESLHPPRAKWVEGRKGRNAIRRGLLRRRELVPEFAAQRPFPRQRQQTIHQQPQGAQLSHAVVEDGKHLLGESFAECRRMQT